MRNKHITAEVIADSVNEFGDRLTSLVIVLPRIVLAELNTHRALSRNSASSRAIPFKKMVKLVQENPFIPIAWQKDHKGMQGTKYFTNDDKLQAIGGELTGAVDYLDINQIKATNSAVLHATAMHNNGVTKQLCNRLLEPFMYHTIIATATEWENFTALRAHPDAEIHIADASEKIIVALNNSTPRKLRGGEWHIPFGENIDYSRFADLEGIVGVLPSMVAVMIATARCARVSYLNYEGKDDYQSDIDLYKILSSVGHWSPFEHCAQTMHSYELDSVNGNGISGNFKGFIQLRKTFKGENKTDSRIN